MKNIGLWKEEFKKHGTLPSPWKKPWGKNRRKNIINDITNQTGDSAPGIKPTHDENENKKKVIRGLAIL